MSGKEITIAGNWNKGAKDYGRRTGWKADCRGGQFSTKADRPTHVRVPYHRFS